MLRFLLVSLFFLVATPAVVAADGRSDVPGPALQLGRPKQGAFLPVQQAFRLELMEKGADHLLLRLHSADGYYLYRQRLSIGSEPDGLLGQAQLPAGEQKQDPYFGPVEVYHGQQDVPIALSKPGRQAFDLVVRYQGCAEKGLCYPLQTQRFAINGGSASQVGKAPMSRPEPFSWGKLALFFLAGLGLTFTPCVLPMLPILSALVLRGSPSPARALSLSLAYTLPMALCFAALGALMGLFGASLNLQARLQSPWVLGPFAALFVLLALSAFDLFEVRLPGWLRRPLEHLAGTTQGGSLTGAASLGVLSALLVSPCVSAPLAGALLYISGSGDAWGGALQLFSLGLGMGTPQLLMVSGGAALIPKSGPWMLAVRRLFGVLLLAVALYLLQRVLPGSLSLWLWGTLAAGYGLVLGALEFHQRGGAGKLMQLLGLALLVYGVCAWVGALRGEQDPWRPLGSPPLAPRQSTTASNWITLTSPRELDEALAGARREKLPVVLVWYADWCASCQIIEKKVLNDPQLQPSLSEFRRLRVDVSKGTPAQNTLLDGYGLFGPPAVLLFDKNGQEARKDRLVGEIDSQTLAARLAKVADQY